MIFTLTAISDCRPIDDKRTWGYCLTREEAINAVARNDGNMMDCYYDYLVIEEYRPGVMSPAEGELWFKWENDRWQSCARPAFADGIVNWAMS